MSIAPASFRPLKTANEPPPSPTKGADDSPTAQRRRRRTSRALAFGVLEACAAFAVFALWLVLFAAGILVDTRPYREVISPSAVAAMDAEAVPPSAASPAKTTPSETPATAATSAATQNAPPANLSRVGWRGQMVAWLVVLLAYLPLNLAWLCAAASTLGTFGGRVNLSDDDTDSEGSNDNTSPYVSALLRGFFVYLFMTSGLLLLDETPFSSPSPGQYIRLAGFLSLFSFVISYQPRLFTALVVSAFQRIQVRDRSQENDSAKSESTVVVRKEATKKEEVVVQQVGDAGKPDQG
jgi:hypothetical protein